MQDSELKEKCKTSLTIYFFVRLEETSSFLRSKYCYFQPEYSGIIKCDAVLGELFATFRRHYDHSKRQHLFAQQHSATSRTSVFSNTAERTSNLVP